MSCAHRNAEKLLICGRDREGFGGYGFEFI